MFATVETVDRFQPAKLELNAEFWNMLFKVVHRLMFQLFSG